MASQVLGSESGATGDAVSTLSGSRSSIENMWVRVSLKSNGGVGVRVTCTGSNENSRLTNIFCENQTESAIAFGIDDNTLLGPRRSCGYRLLQPLGRHEYSAKGFCAFARPVNCVSPFTPKNL
jgi:hypothetical protein